ncbi:MAG TPA: alpha/beta fold hydrolase [Terriglobia bacterium]|nr:alpha/beta fold hydrolase [Terriglobia bacterium]
MSEAARVANTQTMTESAPLQPHRRWLRRTLLILLGLLAALGALVYLRPLWVLRETTRAWLRAEGVRNQDVKLGAYRIHYFVAGEGRPLVLVHGLGSRAEDWAPLIPSLARSGFRVYALDLLGYGRSSRPDVDYSIALETDILRQFFDSQRLQQADLGGWSMGGWICLKFTLDHPERVRRLMVFDSAGLNFKPGFDTGLFSSRTPQEVARFMAVLTPHPPHLPDFVARDLIREMGKESWVVSRSLTAMQGGADLLDGKLGRVQAPVLIVWGNEDSVVPFWCGEEMHREMPQSILAVLDGCGHLAPVECRRRVLPEAQRFLEADPPLPAGRQEFPASQH